MTGYNYTEVTGYNYTKRSVSLSSWLVTITLKEVSTLFRLVTITFTLSHDWLQLH